MSDGENGEGSPGVPADAAGAKSPAAEKSEIAPDDAILDMPIEELDLRVSHFNCLKRANINTVRDLVSLSEADMEKIRDTYPENRHSLVRAWEKLTRLNPDLANNDSAADSNDGGGEKDGV